MNQYVAARQEEFEKIKEFFKKDVTSLRTGRANPGILDNVMVEAYGAKSSINTLGNIGVSDASSVTVTPWDKSVIKDIEKAIILADLGVGVVNEGDKIRLTVPSLTEDNRKDLVKKLATKLEHARVEVRQLRDDIKSKIEADFDDKQISEDDKFRYIKELDETVVKRNDELKELKEKKEKEIMTI